MKWFKKKHRKGEKILFVRMSHELTNEKQRDKMLKDLLDALGQIRADVIVIPIDPNMDIHVVDVPKYEKIVDLPPPNKNGE